jgi:small subunit ribosomal protein S17
MVADKKNPTQLASVDRLVVGEVVSDKMEKTVVVKVVRTFKHAVYGKVVRRHKKFKVHDENNTAKSGDVVEIRECRPLSKSKHMTLVRILSNA